MHKEQEFENYYDNFIQKLRAQQDKIKLTGSPSEFDVSTPFKEYIKTFDCIYAEDGWQLDCYYSHCFTGGKPVIYVRKPDDNIDELLGPIENYRFMHDRRIYKYCESVNTIDHIKVTDINKGLFQLLMLDLIGEDFAIFWHASYGSMDIICSGRDIDELGNSIIDKMKKSDIELVTNFPNIKESKEALTFTFLTYNAWRGLAEESYSIKKEFPHKISQMDFKILVAYNCGIRF